MTPESNEHFAVFDDEGKFPAFKVIVHNANEHSVEFEVFEATSFTLDGIPDAFEKEHYLSAFIKWDGCSTFWFGDSLHLCGPNGYQKHFALMEHLYKKASELMGGIDEEWE